MSGGSGGGASPTINFSEAKADPVANDEDAAKEKARARVSTIL